LLSFQHGVGSASPIFNDVWDNGRKGNYWSDYNGADANGDGTGDTQCVIDESNVGQYSLMTPFNLIPERLNKILTQKTFI
jgi:hypothetical protein